MATLTLQTADNRTATLTTEHSASSYGQPVVVIDGEAYGPADPIPAGEDDLINALYRDMGRCDQWVFGLAYRPISAGPSLLDNELVRAFCPNLVI